LWSSTFSDAAGWNVPQYYATVSYPDINGDGKADLCGRGPSGLMCALSNGTSFGSTSLWSGSFSDAAGWASPQYYTTIQFADVDGDGKADACGRGFGGMLCATSSGSAFNVLDVWDGAYSDNNGWTQPQYYSTLHIVNGVLCGRASDGIYCSFSDHTRFTNRQIESTNESDNNGWASSPAYYSTVTVTRDLRIGARGAGGIWLGKIWPWPDNISMTTVAALNTRRTALITKVWGRSTIDTTQSVDSDVAFTSSDVQGLPTGTTQRRFTINMATSGGVPTGGTTGPNVQGLADLFIPPGGSKKLVILNPGHACNYSTSPYQGSQAVSELVAEGYAVLGTYMPRATPLDCNSGDHDELFDPNTNLRPAGGLNPFVYFLDPVRRGLNHAIASYGFTQFSMAGLSGGGWTTTVYAALDTRIGISVPIAGSEPFYMRAMQDAEQDPNQLGNDFFNFPSGNSQIVTGYKDLYLMGGYGSGRKQVQVLNRDDDCCFGQYGGLYIGVDLPWDQAVRAYELQVRQQIITLGAGAFRDEINEADDCSMTNSCAPLGNGGSSPARHEFSKNARVNVLLSELGGGYSSIGVANDSVAFLRGMDGNLIQSNGSGGWTDTGLAMVGTPAVIKGAANPYDIFYRDPTNHLAHAYFNGTSWAAVNDVASWTIISDPTAISWGPGRIDVVAVDSLYTVVHWFYNGAWNFEHVTSLSPFAVGPVAVSSWGASRLDIVYRTHGAALAHVYSNNGQAPYNVDSSIAAPIRQFPTLTTSPGALWTYVVETDGLLHQGLQINGSSWTWTNVSSAGGQGSAIIPGGPAPFRTPSTGAVKVYARTSTGALGLFSTPSSTWTFANKGGGPFLSSPVATDLGAYVLDTNHQPWQFDGTTWHALGGYFER
jgi:hypothetical protein